MDNVWLAFGLTTIAGLSTGIGSAMVFRSEPTRSFVFQPWFSAGVMILFMIEIYPKAQTVLSSELGSRSGGWVTAIAFFAGILLIAVIDKLIPSAENPEIIGWKSCANGVCSSKPICCGPVFGSGSGHP